MAGKNGLKQEELKNKIGLKPISIEIILSDGSKLVSEDKNHAADVYQWWCQCEEFAGLHGHRYPEDKKLLKTVKTAP